MKKLQPGKEKKFGTVGAVALDKHGNIAAGTSTGGMTDKKYGRVGDSPIIGAGTYAKNITCGVSAPGWGEYFIRLSVAHAISAMKEKQKPSSIRMNTLPPANKAESLPFNRRNVSFRLEKPDPNPLMTCSAN